MKEANEESVEQRKMKVSLVQSLTKSARGSVRTDNFEKDAQSYTNRPITTPECAEAAAVIVTFNNRMAPSLCLHKLNFEEKQHPKPGPLSQICRGLWREICRLCCCRKPQYARVKNEIEVPGNDDTADQSHSDDVSSRIKKQIEDRNKRLKEDCYFNHSKYREYVPSVSKPPEPQAVRWANIGAFGVSRYASHEDDAEARDPLYVLAKRRSLTVIVLVFCLAFSFGACKLLAWYGYETAAPVLDATPTELAGNVKLARYIPISLWILFVNSCAAPILRSLTEREKALDQADQQVMEIDQFLSFFLVSSSSSSSCFLH